MLSSRARQALLDIRDNILLAQEFTAGFSVETFRDDRRTFYAVTRCLEIVSEAARRAAYPTYDLSTLLATMSDFYPALLERRGQLRPGRSIAARGVALRA